MVRILHTADWHLGRPFFGASLLADQAHALDRLVEAARESRADVVLVAGDIYDRAVPPPEAVRLLDETLSRLVLDLKIPTILIAGDHDSPQRLQFAGRLLEPGGLYVVGALAFPLAPIRLETRGGPLEVWALPYAEPTLVGERLGIAGIRSADTAYGALLKGLKPAPASVLLAHAFLAGCEPTESERPLALGQAELVEASRFRGFGYVALGHLHRPQTVGRSKKIRYSGSLIAYSFAEAGEERGVTLAELGPKGSLKIERVALPPLRPLKVLSGTLSELLAEGERIAPCDAYTFARLLDPGPVLHAAEQIRAFYPNLLHLERVPPAPAQGRGPGLPFGQDHAELFAAFFKETLGVDLEAEERAHLEAVLADLRQTVREPAQ